MSASTAQPVCHFEIIGSDPGKLRSYYAALFGWSFATGDAPVADVSQPGEYGFVEASQTGDEAFRGINGGVGGGAGFQQRVTFYVSVDDVEAALTNAEKLGGRRVLGPAPSQPQPGGIVVGHFADPEGNVIGVVSPAA